MLAAFSEFSTVFVLFIKCPLKVTSKEKYHCHYLFQTWNGKDGLVFPRASFSLPTETVIRSCIRLISTSYSVLLSIPPFFHPSVYSFICSFVPPLIECQIIMAS